MWNKLLLGVVVALSLAILSLSLLNKSKGNTIDLLEESLYSYEKASERNLRVIGALEDDVTYLNNLLGELQEFRDREAKNHREIEASWKELRERTDHVEDSTPPDLSGHFRLLQESACSTNRNCL